ncbi:zinc ribbon domain-containing protein, partial [Virgibacillus sp. SK37]|uniref:zinc ribbon domain-containing protein n=1 Tax=Virgibacillus sp. SK37 TaxID=403957 RepID=UPI00351A2671
MHSWSFYQLKQFIKEKASKYNIPVVDINPYQTSQICGCCGHAERKNRNGIKFH